MSKDLNQCNFIGRLGKDPEIAYMPNGGAIAKFSIACGDDYKKDGQKVEKTNWINVVAFGKLAEIIGEYVKKGSKVYISGKQETDEWEKDGIKRYSTKINAREMIMLDSRGAGDSPGEQQQAPSHPTPQQAPSGGMDDFDDDIPF